MSTVIKRLESTGSRDVEMQINRYWGGIKNGVCLQLTAIQEDGKDGYVQINENDWRKIKKLCDKKGMWGVL